MARIVHTVVLLAASALAACGSTPPPKPATAAVAAAPAPLPPRCDPGAARIVIGRLADAATIESARAAAGADLARVLRPDQAGVQDYRAGRLNLYLDVQRRIVSVGCG